MNQAGSYAGFIFSIIRAPFPICLHSITLDVEASDALMRKMRQ
jgi:hypothetical protein